MSNNTGHADQPSFNILVHTLLNDKCQFVNYDNSWALQIGAIVNELEKHTYMDSDIIYSKESKEPYCIVHQYDRVPLLKNNADLKFK
jgi:hypothetical protein